MIISYELVNTILMSLALFAGIVVLGYVLGRLAGYAVSKTLSRTGLSAWLLRLDIGKAIVRGGYTIEEFLGNIIKWVIYVVAVLLATSTSLRTLGLELYSALIADVLNTYVLGFLKAFVVIFVGFIFIDMFISYLYKSAESRVEGKALSPMSEYLRIILYIAIIVFALDVGGLRVSVLRDILMPLIWGLTVVVVIFIASRVITMTFKEAKGK